MNEELIRDCLRMFKQRAACYESIRPKGAIELGLACAYTNALQMLQYAIDGDSENLSQFDYFGIGEG